MVFVSSSFAMLAKERAFYQLQHQIRRYREVDTYSEIFESTKALKKGTKSLGPEMPTAFYHRHG